MKTIAIANQKGGCGKTTTAINLSSALAILGKRILLIDLDPQSHASFGLGVSNQDIDKSIYNVLTDNPEKKRQITDCIFNVSINLDIVPSNILVSTLEQELKDTEDAVSRLYDIISASKLDYDYILIDCAPSLGFLTFNALRAAGLVLVPIDMSAFSLMGVGKLLGMLELIKVKISHAPQVSAVATLFDRRTKYSQTMLDEIKNFFKSQMLSTVIRTSVALKKSAANGISVMKFDPKCNGSIDHMALAREIVGPEAGDELAQVLEEAKSAGSESASQKCVNAMMAVTEEVVRAAKEARAPRIKEMRFSITAPEAKEIYVVGDFNEWKLSDDGRLCKSGDGHWEKRLGLSPGRHKYKFVVDGQWLTDTLNNEREPNMFGTYDSVIEL